MSMLENNGVSYKLYIYIYRDRSMQEHSKINSSEHFTQNNLR